MQYPWISHNQGTGCANKLCPLHCLQCTCRNDLKCSTSFTNSLFGNRDTIGSKARIFSECVRICSTEFKDRDNVYIAVYICYFFSVDTDSITGSCIEFKVRNPSGRGAPCDIWSRRAKCSTGEREPGTSSKYRSNRMGNNDWGLCRVVITTREVSIARALLL